MNAQLPAHLANRQRRDLAGAALGGLNSGSPPHISIAGNRFTLIDDAGNQKPIQTLFLDICVIDANMAVSKIFFDPRVPFEPGGDNNNPPLCFSDNGIGASASATQPQNASCQLCPQNAWGSATSKATGKPTKACNDVKKLAVMVPGIDMVFLLRIPPASLKNLAKYVQTLAGHSVDLPDALTRLEFESQGILKFTPVGYVDEATALLTDKALAAKATDNLVGRNDRPWTGQADAQKVAYAAQAGSPQQASALAPPPPAAPMVLPPQPFQQAPAAPFAQPAAAPPFGQPASAAASPFGGAPAAASSAPEPPKQRKPRTPKPVEAAPADSGIPPFLQRNPAPEAPPPVPPANTFGMNPNPPAPDAGIQKALDDAFRLPT